jgi:hypothetical protein
MALVTSVLLQGVRGKFGDKVFRQRNGKTHVDPMPVFNPDRIPTKKELDVRAKFAASVAYARKAMADPGTKEVYQKKAYRKKTAYGIAFRHATKSPVVRRIDVGSYTGLPKSQIIIIVFDDVRVEEVTVSIVTADGVLVEEGKAYLPDGHTYNWTYVATQVNNEMEGCKVIVVAKNLPGNKGVLESGVANYKKHNSPK